MNHNTQRKDAERIYGRIQLMVAYDNEGKGSISTRGMMCSMQKVNSIWSLVTSVLFRCLFPALAFFCGLNGVGQCPAPTFTLQSPVISGVDYVNDVDPVDMDGDGDVDILSVSRGDYEVAWYENDGTQNFTKRSVHTYSNIGFPFSVHPVDLDQDGDVDILSTYTGLPHELYCYENDGSMNFLQRVIAVGVNHAHDVFSADIDGDGDIDVVSNETAVDEITWYENDGSENFTVHNVSTAPQGTSDIVVEDIDSDGDVDVVCIAQDNDLLTWHENDGSGNFSDHTISSNADYGISVHAVDVDSDGDMDVVSSSYLDAKFAWFENDGSENFTEHLIASTFDFRPDLHSADLDNDGDMDLLTVSNSGDYADWYENDGSQNFTRQLIDVNLSDQASIATADVNGDGGLDIIVGTRISNTAQIVWFETDCIVAASDPCDPVASGNVDFDSDGVSDVCDLDDDNDGILDTDEQSDCNGPISGVPDASIVNNTPFILGQMHDGAAVDDTGPEFNTNGHYVIVDLGQTVSAGATVRFDLWQFNTTPNSRDFRFAQLPTSAPDLGGGTNILLDVNPGLTDTWIVNYVLDENVRYVQVEMTRRLAGRSEITEATILGCLADQDTDSDGNPDRLDLDSDGDGCFDVKEAGFTDTDADGLLGPNPVLVDSDGLVTSGSDGYTGTDPQVTDAAFQFGCTDNDNDGISDLNDLDDDNDGILDSDEGHVDASPVPSSVISATEASWTDMNISMTAGNFYEFTAISSSFGPITATGGPYNGQQLFLMQYAHTARTDLDGNRYSLSGSYWNTPAPPINIAWANLTSADYANELRTIGLIDVNGNGTFDAGTDELIDPLLQVNGAVVMQASVSGDFYAIYADAGVNVGNAGEITFSVYEYSLRDNDTDGVPDHLDLDSDNDGIHDALEAGHGQTHLNGVVSGAVDAFGIPSAVSDGAGGVNFTLVNSDGVGYADPFSQDSDNDGCSDVLEAAFTDDNFDGVLGDVPITVDSDGLVTSGSDGYTGTTAFVINASQQSGCADNDGDLISDVNDLDDDNDGLLDTEECGSLGPELIQNGDFENGYAHWTSNFNRGRNNHGPTAGGCPTHGWIAVSPCSSTNGTCAQYFDYGGGTSDGSVLITDPIGTGANILITTNCNQSALACLPSILPDHTSGAGNSLFVDPNDVPGEAYLKQDVTIEANKTYVFSAWIMVIKADANIQFKIDGAALTSTLTLVRQTGGSEGPDTWQEVSAIWNSGASTGSVELSLVSITSECVGHDIRLDDLSLREMSVDDTDGDGIADCFDLDSDGDGCYDVLEAGFTDDNFDGTLGDNPVTVDLDGLVTSGSDGYTGTNAFVTNAAQQGGCVDNDNDGISDLNDLDDDNDGILDIDELDCEIASTATILPTNDGVSVADYSVPPAGWTLINGTPDISDVNGWAGDLDYSWAGYPVSVPPNGDSLWVTGYREEEVGTTMSDLVVGELYQLTVYRGLFGNDIPGGPAGDEYLYPSPEIEILVDGVAVDTSFYSGASSPNWQAFSFEFTASSASMGLSFRNTTAYQSDLSTLADPSYVWNISFRSAVCLPDNDTDGDGVVNSFDLDSDNDGIYDVWEAGHGQLQVNGVVNSSIDAYGIPLLVSNGLGGVNYPYVDSDGNNTLDAYQLDSDADGCYDVIEAGYTDANNDGVLGTIPVNVDSNGLVIQ